MMNAEPLKEHRWLEGLVGDWTYESEPCGVPGQEPAKFTGTESVRSMGGLWVVGESQSQMPGGGPAQMMITLGFDPGRKRFIGTWVGSMMTNMWVYEGERRGRQVDGVHVGALSAPEMSRSIRPRQAPS